MRICLYWNESAGGGVSLHELERMIEREGHTIARVIEHRDELARLRGGPIDCLVAAGGDGTVAKAGRLLAGGHTPLAILPLGTANNIASSLAIGGELADLIAAWKTQTIVRIDMGVVEDARGRCYFLEGVGVGLIPLGIEAGRKTVLKSDGGDPAEQVARARRVYLDTLLELQPRHYGLSIDGAAIEEAALLVEVLNVSSVGPRIRLSPEANPADGLLSVVMATSEDRDAIASHLRARWDDGTSHARLKSWRAARVEVTGWHHYHVDDDVRVAEGETISIAVKPGFLPVLA
jgi:diacylglycerol kinase family enzyme